MLDRPLVSEPRQMSLGLSIKALLRRRGRDDDRSEELQFHLRDEIERSMLAGMHSR